MESDAKEILCGDTNSKVKSEDLIRGSAGVSMEMARDGLEGVRTGYNTLSTKDLAFDNLNILQGNPEEVAAYSMGFQSEMKVEPHFSQCLGY